MKINYYYTRYNIFPFITYAHNKNSVINSVTKKVEVKGETVNYILRLPEKYIHCMQSSAPLLPGWREKTKIKWVK